VRYLLTQETSRRFLDLFRNFLKIF